LSGDHENKWNILEVDATTGYKGMEQAIVVAGVLCQSRFSKYPAMFVKNEDSLSQHRL